jgi:hypothetical protein
MRPRILPLIVALCVFSVHGALAQNGDYIVIEDFETDAQITLNTMANQPLDGPEAFEWVENPAPDEVNPSAMVMQFTRSAEGDPWAGFWSILPETIDLTTHKYMHVQVWKPRVSPVRFKIEGGGQPAFEILPMEAQEETEQWENLVFYFEDATGEYPTIVFMPDFEDPLTLEENIVIYFDNIVLSNSPVPPAVTSTEGMELPRSITLDQNYPNPFNPSTTISFTLATSDHVTLAVYDLTGRHVATLVDGMRTAGSHEVTFSAGNLPSGVYIYRLQSSDRSFARVLTLLK